MSLWDPIQRFTRRGRELARARRKAVAGLAVLAGLGALLWWQAGPLRGPETLLVVSYDVTREYFAAINAARQSADGAAASGAARLSHAGSVEQAHNVARGLVADAISFAAAAEVDALVRGGLVHAGWADRLPYRSSPYSSTIVFVVRAGNPRGIRDWDDLLRADVRVASPDPRLSGAGRYAYLAAHAAAANRHAVAGRFSEAQARMAWEDVAGLYTRMDWISLGARQALEVFRRDGRADVFLTWECEGLRLARAGDARLEMVGPPVSILAEPVVAMVDAHVDRRGTRAGATQYLEFLFSPEGQAIAARHGLRPRLPEALAAAPDAFPAILLVSLDDAFGGYEAAWREHFGAGGTLERVLLLREARRGGIE